MKKVMSLILALALTVFSFLPGLALADEKKISVVATIFPVYDWVREVAAGIENVEAVLLLDTGVDLHSYQPTVPDILKISSSDLFLYVGGESDEWVEEVLAQVSNQKFRSISLVEAMGEDIKMEETVEGMEQEHHEEEDGHDHEHEEEADEHVWLSLRNAQKLVRIIASELSEIDPAHKDAFQANASAYIAKLAALDQQYAEAVNAAANRTLLFADRFPFRYLVDDYGLNYYAAFSGCSAETEASFETVAFLVGKVNELSLNAVLTIEGPDHRVAETIVANSNAKNQQVLTLDSLQSTTALDAKNGKTYLSTMETNLEVLKEALK